MGLERGRADFRLSAITFLERCRGWELRLRRDPGDEAARAKLAAVSALRTAYAERIISIDAAVALEWARQLGTKGNNDRDAALAATAKVHGLELVTRNIRHFTERGIVLLDPFNDPPRRYPASPAARKSRARSHDPSP